MDEIEQQEPNFVEEAEPKESKSKLFIILSIVIILLLAVASYVFFLLYQERFLSPIVGEVFSEEIIDLHLEGDPNVAREKLVELLPYAKSKSEEALIKLTIAENTKENEIAYKLFREIASDVSYPDFERGIAIQAMADRFMLGRRNPSVAVANIFVEEEPYMSFLEPSSTGNGFKTASGIRNLYEYSLTFAELPISEYRIAEWWSRRLLRDISLEEKREALQNAKTHIERGDDALLSYLAWAEQNFRPSHAIYTRWIRGHVLGTMSSFERNQKLSNDAELDFKRATVQYDIGIVDVYEKAQLLWADFHYAAFLMYTYNDVRSEDIEGLLNEISDILESEKQTSFGFRNYLIRIGTRDFAVSPFAALQIYDKETILQLATYSQSFKNLLKELRWSENVFLESE